MNTDASVLHAHMIAKSVQMHASDALRVINTLTPHRNNLRPEVLAQFQEMWELLEKLNNLGKEMLTDQTRWGIYRSHPSGNNN